MPTHDPLNSFIFHSVYIMSPAQNVEKEFKKAEEAHAKYQQKLTEDPNFLEALKEEVQKLQEQVAAVTTAAN